MELKVFNNLKRQKETFKPLETNHVKFYSCGPTTYDFLHVGNARALVVGDLMHRILKFLGYQVTFVRNFTDVDDKIIDRARELNRNPIEHAALFVDECLKDMQSLGMQPATHMPKVSETMPEIIQMIQDILRLGHGYVVEGEVFFHTPSYKSYGQLSKKDLEGLAHGQRVEVDQRKKHPSDFVLWKPAKSGEPSWDSPWGKGRPGWHIECSAMAKKFLGETLDLHHGGVDLMFPHHENEIAQSEAANQKTFCGCWAHNEFLNFGSEKMSKSLGNVVTIRSFIEKYGGQVLRQILISVHYRARLDWTEETIERAIHDVEKLHQFRVDWKNFEITTQGLTEKAPSTLTHLIKSESDQFLEEFTRELANDFNSAGALGGVFNYLRFLRRDVMTEKGRLEAADMDLIKGALSKANLALGFFHADPESVLQKLQNLKGSSKIDTEWVEKLLQERTQAKQSKNWSRADEIRKELSLKNIQIIDNKDGTSTWKMQ
jgi:cysteinyl-tRNA synthetase